MTWIAVTADHRHLRAIRKRFRRAGCEAYVACHASRRIAVKGSKAKHRRSIEILMPYVLVKAPDYGLSLWLYSVRETKDVRGVVGSKEHGPYWIPDHAIAEVKDGVRKLRFIREAARSKHRLAIGQKARHRSGKTGRVDWIRSGKAGLETTLFGSSRVVEVLAKDLEAA